ncbi:MAG: hypothetical protein ACKPKO_46175, partial [Candidatus Fonsibacter sp.]
SCSNLAAGEESSDAVGYATLFGNIKKWYISEVLVGTKSFVPDEQKLSVSSQRKNAKSKAPTHNPSHASLLLS